MIQPGHTQVLTNRQAFVLGLLGSITKELGFLSYLFLFPVVQCLAFDCRLASLDDIACMKLAAITQRGSKKDFIDMYAICKKHRPLHELIKLAKKV